MSDEAGLLAALGGAAREPDIVDDPRWEGFAAGTLSDEERAALLAEARAKGLAEEVIAAFAPREEAFDERLAAELVSAVNAKARPAAKAAPAEDLTSTTRATPAAKAKPTTSRRGDDLLSTARATPAAKAKATAESASTKADAATAKPAPVIPLVPSTKAAPSPRRSTWMIPAGIVLAAAAGAMLLLRSANEERWPAYALAVEGDARSMRSTSPGEELRFVPESTITLVARPEKGVAAQATEKAEARAFVSAGGASRRWEVPIEIAAGGAARITGRAGELFAKTPGGVLRVCIAVGSATVVGAMNAEPAAPGADARYGLACSSVRWLPEGTAP